MNTASLITTGVVALAALICFTGCATRGKAMRVAPENDRARTPKADAWYIESAAPGDTKPFSCSFVEFDERGDYLDFRQHRDAYQRVRDLSKTNRLLFVIYVHGWKNNSQSEDVVRFNLFLKQISDETKGEYRVHGLFLSWRGNSMKHALDANSHAFRETVEAYGEPIVDLKYARNWLQKPFVWLPEQLSYWSRKNAAEDKVSGVPLIRTIYSCGYAARRYSNEDRPNLVFLFGHSFGALMLEQSFAPASLSELSSEWPWDDPEITKQAKSNPLPFDLVMYVNSAAPSIYAKQYYEYMVAHREALAFSHVVGSDAPIVISVTSTGDWATKIAHKWGNALAGLRPSLWRKYNGTNFILRMPANAPTVEIPQAYYYKRTPGHNPLLVSHWVVPQKESATQAEPQKMRTLQRPISPSGKVTADEADVTAFTTSPRRQGSQPKAWQITTDPPDPKWSSYAGYPALCVGPQAAHSGYWIVRCPKEIIKDHGDVWSQQAMDMYKALFVETVYLRKQPPDLHRRATPPQAR